MEQSTIFPASASIDAPRLGIFNPETARPVAGASLTPKLTPEPKRKRKEKPDRECPLWLHPSGRWCKKIKGRVHYFGRDIEAALLKWAEQRDDLLSGRTPRVKSDGLVLGDLCERFLNGKRVLMQSGELSPRTFADYLGTCTRLVEQFGKHRRVDDLASDDFESLRATFSKTRGPVGLANAIRLTRIVFKYAVDAGLIEKAVRFGPLFQVKRETIRKAAAGKAARMFEAAEIRQLLDTSDDTMKAMVLLGINCAFGQADLAALQQSVIDLKGGFVSFPRPKTGVDRRCPLWPETLAALRKAIALRPEPKDTADADCVFLTPHRNRLVRSTTKYGHRDWVGVTFGRLLTELMLKRPGLSFYALRHTFRTIADSTRDFPAIDLIMGHSDATMGGRYRERIDDSRLQAVVNHVRGWLFPSK